MPALTGSCAGGRKWALHPLLCTTATAGASHCPRPIASHRPPVAWDCIPGVSLGSSSALPISLISSVVIIASGGWVLPQPARAPAGLPGLPLRPSRGPADDAWWRGALLATGAPPRCARIGCSAPACRVVFALVAALGRRLVHLVGGGKPPWYVPAQCTRCAQRGVGQLSARCCRVCGPEGALCCRL